MRRYSKDPKGMATWLLEAALVFLSLGVLIKFGIFYFLFILFIKKVVKNKTIFRLCLTPSWLLLIWISWVYLTLGRLFGVNLNEYEPKGFMKDVFKKLMELQMILVTSMDENESKS